jgi:DNA invertase Pin-like site-specific DNA recombinase
MDRVQQGNQMRFGGYIRVSRVAGRTGDRFLSPTLQREKIEGWCQTHGHQLAVVKDDLDVSGAREDRERLMGLVEEIEAGQLDGLVVATLDRFGRSLPFAIALIDRIDRAGGQFVSVADGLDTKTPYGRLALNIMLSIAQFELERIKAQWRSIVERQIREGRHPGATPPFGYERDDAGRLIPGKNAPVVQEVFTRVAAGESISPIARDLTARGIRTQRGGRIARGVLHHVLGNRVYLGEARAGDLLNHSAHKPLVDEATFRAAQISRPKPPRTGVRAVLAGMIRCQGCRYAMAPVMRSGRRRYRCLGNQQGRVCAAPAFVTELELLPVVEEQLFDRIGEINAVAAGDTERIDELQTARERAERALVVVRDDPEIIDRLGPRGYADALAVRGAALAAADEALSRELASRPRNLPDAAMLRSAWPEMDNETRSGMLRAVFDAIVVRKHPSRSQRLTIRDRVRFLPRGTLAPGDVPRSSRDPAGPIRPFDWPSDPPSPWITPA